MYINKDKFAFAVAGIVMLGACANLDAPVDSVTSVTEAAAASTAAPTASSRIEADVHYLADDALEGREAGSAGYREAAEYVAARMATIGLEPAGDDGWFQEVPLRAATPIPEASEMSVKKSDGEVVTLKSLEDFRLFPSLDSPEFDLTAPAVFVGYGVVAPEAGHDDYAGLDVDGKIVVMFGGAPALFDSERRAHYGSGGVKTKEAAARGAVGVVTLRTAANERSTPWERFVANPTNVRMTWIGPNGRADISGPGVKGGATLRASASGVLFSGATKSFEDLRKEVDDDNVSPAGFDLAVEISMKGAISIVDTTSPNVAGVVRGADPSLRDEVVVLSAHLDHIGISERLVREGKDGINNGAMDNAVGIATMLEAAQQFINADKPRRSVVFLAVTAEEKGLLGADYFAHFPTTGPDSLVANVNLDMPVVLYSFTDVVAFGAERSTLGLITQAALDAAGVTLAPDPIPELGVFTRSDHYRFVEQGIPSVFLWPGFGNGGEEAFWEFYRTTYHKPNDDVSQPILYDDIARFADVNFVIARQIANETERPRWVEGDFFGDLFGR